MTRPVHPEHTNLFDEIDQVTATVEKMLTAITGKRQGFVLVVVPPTLTAHASTIASNLTAELALDVVRGLVAALEPDQDDKEVSP